MAKRKDETTTPPVSEPSEVVENTEATPDKPIDPKELARQRSKEDLARKRRQMHRKGGRR